MPNVDLLRSALAQVEADPNTWQQASWAIDLSTITENECGTAHCIGGWATVLHGATLDPKEPAYVQPLPGDVMDDDTDRYTDGTVETWDYARSILRLDERQATRLFRIENTLPDLRRIVASLCEGAAQ